MGRGPAKDWETLAPAVLESVKSGKPLGRTCEDLGLLTATLQNYRKKHPDYDKELKEAIADNPGSKPGFSKNPVRNPKGVGGYPKGISGNPLGTTSEERETRERTRHKGLLAKEAAIEAMAELPAVAAKNLSRLDKILDKLFNEWESGELDTKEFLAAKDRLQKDMDSLSKFVPKESFKQEESLFEDKTSPAVNFSKLPAAEQQKLLGEYRETLDAAAKDRKAREDAFRSYDDAIDVESRDLN